MLYRARRILIRLAFLGFVCRALVPIGLMPAAFDDGGPFKFCHDGAAGELFRVLASRAVDHAAIDHAAHHDHSASAAGRAALDAAVDADSFDERTAEHAGWEHCPIGTAFAHAAVASAELHFDGVPLEHALNRVEPPALVARLFAGVYRARAPPIV
jgi:hypothetical protein